MVSETGEMRGKLRVFIMRVVEEFLRIFYEDAKTKMMKEEEEEDDRPVVPWTSGRSVIISLSLSLFLYICLFENSVVWKRLVL